MAVELSWAWPGRFCIGLSRTLAVTTTIPKPCRSLFSEAPSDNRCFAKTGEAYAYVEPFNG